MTVRIFCQPDYSIFQGPAEKDYILFFAGFTIAAAFVYSSTGLRHFIFDRFLKNALFTAFRQYFFVKFPAFYCCMVLYIYLACVIIFL